ncbi:MAG TPA: fibronectin type III domain-containing protein [candidate division Zixibacteria bacterium]
MNTFSKKALFLFSFFLFVFSFSRADELRPPSDLKAFDTPDDGGGGVTFSWKLSPHDREPLGDIDGYEIYRKAKEDSTYRQIDFLPDNQTTYNDYDLKDKTQYSYAIRARKGEEFSGYIYSNYVSPKPNWFRFGRTNVLLMLLVFSLAVLLFIRSAKRGKPLFVRKINGLDAIEEGVGRATEMGKSVLFVPGIGDVDDIQTIAGLSILSRVAHITAEYETRLICPVLYPLPFAAAQEMVKSAYIDEGKAEDFKPDTVRYVAGEQFAYVAAVSGIMFREKPAANLFMGAFYAESLLLAESGQSTGAIQVAGTANPEQLPFFIAACDYTLMGEELFAASAYLSKEPLMLGSLKGQDWMKIILIAIVIVGVVLETLHLGGGFFTKLFVEH